MIKILQIGFSPNYGGVESCVMNYYRNIDKNNVQFGFLNIYGKKIAAEEEIINLGGNVHYINNWNNNPFKMFKELKSIINDNNYDIVHFNMNGIANLVQFYCAEKSNAKWIVHSHNSGTTSGLVKQFIERFSRIYIKKNASLLFACSDKASNYMFHSQIDNNKVYLINNAIDLSKFEFDKKTRTNIRKKYNLNDSLVLGNVGRLEEQKNHIFLIKLVDKLVNDGHNIKLIIVGEGTKRKELEQAIAERKLQDRIFLLGACKNVNELYQAMDILVMPSLFEGLPVSGIEAQAAGLPCVFSTNITKELDIASNNKFIDLEEPIENWVNACIALSKVSRNKSSSEVLTLKGYNINQETERLIKLYKKVLGEDK